MYELRGGGRTLSRNQVKSRRQGFLSAQTAPRARPRAKLSRPECDTLAKAKGFAVKAKVRLVETPHSIFTIRAITAHGLIFFETGMKKYHPKNFELHT